MLDRILPGWRDIIRELRRSDLNVDPRGYKELMDQRRAESIALNSARRLNQRTATAALGVHSKPSLREAHQAALEHTEVTHDGLIRIRPNPGLVVQRGKTRWDAQELSRCLGELILTERALRDGTTLSGELPAALLTVENLGPYIDLQLPPGWMVAHVPGWNVAMLHLFVEQLPGVPIVHFGDLDPDGVRIVEHLRRIYPDLRWAVPSFWAEHIELRAQPCEWPLELNLQDAPSLVQRLAAKGIWLGERDLAGARSPRYRPSPRGLSGRALARIVQPQSGG